MNIVLVIFDTLRRNAVGARAGPPPWGAAMTVITDRWWYNAKVEGRGARFF